MRARYGLSWMGLVLLLALYLTTVTVAVPAHAASPARIKSVLLLSRSARVLESCPVVDFTHSLIKNQAGTWTIRWDQVTQTRTGTGTVEWVDVHVTRTSGTEHYRMWQSPLSSPNRAVMVYTFENPNNLLTPGEIISYSFTIKSDIACDTQLYTETVPLAATTLSPTTATCPAIQFSSSVADGKIYFTPTSPSPAINWIDVHIQHALTRAATHSHHRMTLSASSTPSAPMFEAAIPSDVAAQFAYSFTYSAGNIQCDTTGFTHNGGSTTEPTNPAPTNPPAPSSTPSTVCPAVEFGHTIVGSINNGETTNTIYFDVVLPKLVTYVEVHITHNGAQYNYRMTLHETNSYSTVYKFVQPQFLNWTPGQSVSYFFTYLATELGIQCDTPVYTLTEG